MTLGKFIKVWGFLFCWTHDPKYWKAKDDLLHNIELSSLLEVNAPAITLVKANLLKSQLHNPSSLAFCYSVNNISHCRTTQTVPHLPFFPINKHTKIENQNQQYFYWRPNCKITRNKSCFPIKYKMPGTQFSLKWEAGGHVLWHCKTSL